MPPFLIDDMKTTVSIDPAACRKKFAAQSAVLVFDAIAPRLLARLMAQAAEAEFIDDNVKGIGTREIEARQKVGGTISLLLGRPSLLRWLESVTGRSPLRAVAGRLVQTRANGQDELEWHNDMDGSQRLLGIVINLSTQPFAGGLFELRKTVNAQPLLSYHHNQPGSMLIFDVHKGIEHRVTQVSSGGPRRVYSGWFLAAPEHPGGPLLRPIASGTDS